MLEARIIDRGRGPEITGTRITVYAIYEYLQDHWRRDDIASWLGLSKEQVDVATRYIEEHREVVALEFAKIMERISRGNPPEIQAKMDATRGTALARLKEIRQAKKKDPAVEGHSGGQRRHRVRENHPCHLAPEDVARALERTWVIGIEFLCAGLVP